MAKMCSCVRGPVPASHHLCFHLAWEVCSCPVPCVLVHRHMLAEVMFMTLELLRVLPKDLTSCSYRSCFFAHASESCWH